MLTNNENLIFQTYSNVELFVCLKSNDFIESDYFNTIAMEPWLRDVFKQINVDNQGFLLMSLYAMVVVPKQLIENEFKKEFLKVEKFLEEKLYDEDTTYDYSKYGKQYLRHIRNSIAHANIEFQENDYILFKDKNNDKTFEAKMKLKDIGRFLTIIREIHIKYSQKINKTK